MTNMTDNSRSNSCYCVYVTDEQTSSDKVKLSTVSTVLSVSTVWSVMYFKLWM